VNFIYSQIDLPRSHRFCPADSAKIYLLWSHEIKFRTMLSRSRACRFSGSSRSFFDRVKNLGCRYCVRGSVIVVKIPQRKIINRNVEVNQYLIKVGPSSRNLLVSSSLRATEGGTWKRESTLWGWDRSYVHLVRDAGDEEKQKAKGESRRSGRRKYW